MHAHDDSDETMRGYDLAPAGPGRYADLWTPESREAFLRESAIADADAWTAYLQEELDGLMAALFAMRVILCGESPRNAAVGSAMLDPGPRAGALRRPARDESVESRLRMVRSEREWAAGRHPDRERLYGASWVERMHRLTREARALRTELEDEVSRHLAGGGLTPGEIDRRRAEMEKLRLAA